MVRKLADPVAVLVRTGAFDADPSHVVEATYQDGT